MQKLLQMRRLHRQSQWPLLPRPQPPKQPPRQLPPLPQPLPQFLPLLATPQATPLRRRESSWKSRV